MADNRKFAIIWSLIQFLYGSFCLFLSFYQEDYERCRNAYIATMALSVLAFVCALFFARKTQLSVYFSMLINDISLLGAGLLIAWFLLQNGTRTIMIFAAPLIFPILFVSSTLSNIIIALIDIIAAVFLLRHGLSAEIYRWCISDLIIFSSMGVTLGHFVNKARYERYVFAESAVQLAESNAKIAELQTKYAYYDQMTGLKNRRAYSEKIEELKKEMPADCFVIMADSNGLKQTNDTLGHLAGDELIIGAADCLRRGFEGVKTIYRLGGDEFCVIARGSEEEIKNSLSRLEKICSEWEGKYVSNLSVSYGVASAEEFSDIASILRAADKRMYEFKNNYYKTAVCDKNKDLP